MVKIFPAGVGGPQFFKDLKGPFPHIEIMPTGAVNRETAPQFIKAGAFAIGVGGELVGKPLIAARNSRRSPKTPGFCGAREGRPNVGAALRRHGGVGSSVRPRRAATPAIPPGPSWPLALASSHTAATVARPLPPWRRHRSFARQRCQQSTCLLER